MNEKILSAAIFIINDKNELLMLKRPPEALYLPNVWTIPGGKLEDNESLDDCIIRETLEECSLIVHDIDWITSREADIYIVNFAVAKSFEGVVEISDEHVDYMWVPIKNIINNSFNEIIAPKTKEILLLTNLVN